MLTETCLHYGTYFVAQKKNTIHKSTTSNIPTIVHIEYNFQSIYLNKILVILTDINTAVYVYQIIEIVFSVKRYQLGVLGYNKDEPLYLPTFKFLF